MYESLKGNKCRTSRAVKHLKTALSGIERKARKDQKHKFENLYGLFNKWNLGECVAGAMGDYRHYCDYEGFEAITHDVDNSEKRS